MSREREISNGEEHREIDLLLPWYVNRTLEPHERERVEQHLAVCALCQREVRALTQLQSAVILSSEEIPAPSRGGLERVLARIEADERSKKVQQAVWWAELWDRLRAAVLPPPLPAWRLVPVLAILVIVVQFAAIVGLVGREYLGPVSYRTLARPPEGVPSRSPRIVVVFQEGAPESAIRETLLVLQGVIVGGPTPQGAYTVEIKKPLASSQELDWLLEDLRAKADLVKLAEKAF